MELFGITLTDGVGYLASLLLMISFALKNVRSLRIVNSFGLYRLYNLWIYVIYFLAYHYYQWIYSRHEFLLSVFQKAELIER